MAEERARAVVVGTTRSETRLQLQTNRVDISTIRRLLLDQAARNYKGESAKVVRAALRSRLHRSSRHEALVVRMGVEGVVLDLPTEAHEQAKGTLHRIFITSPVLTPATSGESEGIPSSWPVESAPTIQGSPRPELIAFAT